MQLEDSVLSALGIIGYYLLAVKRKKIGLTIGGIYNLLWILYAISTHQWPFISICAIFIGVNIHAYYKWEDSSNVEQAEDHPDHGSASVG